jgi:hypothetical protein
MMAGAIVLAVYLSMTCDWCARAAVVDQHQPVSTSTTDSCELIVGDSRCRSHPASDRFDQTRLDGHERQFELPALVRLVTGRIWCLEDILSMVRWSGWIRMFRRQDLIGLVEFNCVRERDGSCEFRASGKHV